MDAANTPTRPRALIGWRLLSLAYDALPVIAMWMLLSLLANLAWTYLGGHDEREYIAPFTVAGWLLWAMCWWVAGAYAVRSWRRGGQTLGMRPWRLKVVATDGGPAAPNALWKRYAVATLSLLAAGLGFWWAWFDGERLTWHDRASGTRMLRTPKRPS